MRDQLVAGTGGNPLALVELAGALTADQLAGRAPLPSAAAADRRGRAGVPRPLPAAGRAGAAVPAGRRGRRHRPAAPSSATPRTGSTPATTALDEVERAGLLRVDGDAVALYHPLVRSAVYRAATSAQRRAAHRALADALARRRRPAGLAPGRRRRPARREVVAALDAVAERAAARGGHEAAAAAWARAAELTAGGEDRAAGCTWPRRRRWLGAHPSRAAALAERRRGRRHRAACCAPGCSTLQGQIEWNTGSLNDGYDLIAAGRRGRRAASTRRWRGSWRCSRAALAAFGARSPRAESTRPRWSPDPPPDAPPARGPRPPCCAGSSRVRRDGLGGRGGRLPRRVRAHRRDPVDDHVLQPNLGIAALLIDDDERGLRLHEQQLTAARRAGALDHGRARPDPRRATSRSRPEPGRRRPRPRPRRCRWPRAPATRA